ncbi:MAG: hypothetical protein LBC65_04015 [Oscillospiraceae bacterium]|jgi:hypothetical protein|nr:hypothetical protein [Oscillospiraceae bacterium]
MARSAATYKNAVKSFKVETNQKYQPVKNAEGKVIESYCNVFAFDVMKHSDVNAPLPTKDDGVSPALCEKMLETLTGGT